MNFDLWGLVAGLGFFLLGMSQLEQGLQGFGTQRIKRVLANNTRTPLRGVLTGTAVTAFLQSSSMVGLITQAFVGAGLLQLGNALGIIIGANLGTTFTGWLVTTIGFKLNLGTYALPWLGIGALGVVLLKQQTAWSYTCKVILGLGLLLFGLDFMKASMDFLKHLVDLQLLSGYPLWVYALAGMVFSALIQSSSATMIIVLSAMSAGVLPLLPAAAIIVGADLGTTSTVLLGSIGGTPNRKRVALSHLCFNLLTDVIAFLLIIPFLHVITEILGVKDVMYALVLFHSGFNVMGILVFLPLIKPFTRFLNQRFTEDDIRGAHYINGVSPSVPEAALHALKKDITRLIHKVIVINLRCLNVNIETAVADFTSRQWFEQVNRENLSYDDMYADIKYTENQLIRFAYRILAENPSTYPHTLIRSLLGVARDAAYSAKCLKDIRSNLIQIQEDTDEAALLEKLGESASFFYLQLQQLLEKTNPLLLDDKIMQLRKHIEETHIKMHDQITEYISQSHSTDHSLSMLNINREFYVSQQTFLHAVSRLVKVPGQLPNNPELTGLNGTTNTDSN